MGDTVTKPQNPKDEQARPENEDKGEVHPTDKTTTQHPRLFVVSGDVESDGVVELVWPGDRQELLPPTRGNEGDVEAEDEGERDQSEERIEISDDALEKPEIDKVCQNVPKHQCHLFCTGFITSL